MAFVLDLWCGTKSATKIWADMGHTVVSVDFDAAFEPTICDDIANVTSRQLLDLTDGEGFLFGWASPQCTIYSLMNMRWNRHFISGHPATDEAFEQNFRVRHTIHLLAELCKYWVLENPRAMLRTQPFMREWPRETVSYCRYGDSRMKPTDLWGKFPRGWVPRPMCRRGHPDHTPAPRGSTGGTQGMNSIDAGRIPFELTHEIFTAVLADKGVRYNLGDFEKKE
jgi:hypothetical protein